MKYLLDSNVMMLAKRTGYHFDICPGFWEWLEEKSRRGSLFSLSNVASEIKEGGDELSEWSKSKGKHIFVSSVDPETYAKMPEVSDWVMAQGYKESSRSEFFKKADPFIVAHALAHGFTVVTLEIRHNDKNQVKIPNVCEGLGVGCMSPWDMLKREKVRFILEEFEWPEGMLD